MFEFEFMSFFVLYIVISFLIFYHLLIYRWTLHLHWREYYLHQSPQKNMSVRFYFLSFILLSPLYNYRLFKCVVYHLHSYIELVHRVGLTRKKFMFCKFASFELLE